MSTATKPGMSQSAVDDEFGNMTNQENYGQSAVDPKMSQSNVDSQFGNMTNPKNFAKSAANPLKKANPLSRGGGKNQGKGVAKQAANKVANKVADRGIDAAAKGLAAETGGASIVAGEVIKRYKKQTLVLILLIAVWTILPLLFIFFVLLGGGIEYQKSLNNVATTLTIQKTGPATVANPAGNGPEMKYHIDASSTGDDADTGNATACGQKSTPPTGNDPKFTCSGGKANTSSQPSSDGYYQSTQFGCNFGFQKDPNDNCVPACPTSYAPECNGRGGRDCEEQLAWYSANANIYGCGTKLKVTNPTTGKAVIVRAMDYGPSCSVQSGRQKFDVSQMAAKELGGDGIVKVEKVDDNTKLGPANACTADSRIPGKTDPQTQLTTDIRGAVAAAANINVDIILRPKEKDSYVINTATVTSTANGIMVVETIPANAIFVSATGTYVTDPPAGGAATKTVTWTSQGTGSGDANTGDVTPNKDTCGKKYNLNNPIGNFGDPQCNYNKQQMEQQIKQLDAGNATTWDCIVKHESGYNANAYNGNSTSGKGAYGLFQMNPAGKGNGKYDAGSVNWTEQIVNAISYRNKTINGSWAYWGTRGICGK